MIIPVEAPVGTVLAYVGKATTLESLEKKGWFLCDGRNFNRDDCPELYEAIGYAFGQNGTNFYLPDLRGMFIRGVNDDSGKDPDVNSRIAQNEGGNIQDKVGSQQADGLKAHAHMLNVNRQGNPDGWDDRGNGRTYWSNQWASSNPLTEESGGEETRPKNVYVYYIIKYKMKYEQGSSGS